MAALLLAACFAAAALGFALLALSQGKHWQRAAASPVAASPRPRLLRWAGAAALVAALLLAILRDGPSFGAILWVVLLSPAAALAVVTLALAPRRLRVLTRLAGARGDPAAR